MADRQCGACQLCCTLLPVRELDKVALTRCRYQRFGKGCIIYARRPPACQMWSCLWLMDTNLIGRPDHVHYVVDPMDDVVAGSDPDKGVMHATATQVWVDPKYPDAHRDPNLRAYLLTQRSQGLAIIRYGSKDGIVLVPPDMSHTGGWYEKPSVYTSQLPESTYAPKDFQVGAEDQRGEDSLQEDDPARTLREQIS